MSGARPLTWEGVEAGEDLGTIEYVLSPEKLDLFRRAVRDPSARFPTIASKEHYYLLRSRYEVGTVINARHEARYLRPPDAEARITVRGRVAEKYVRRERRYLVVECESTDDGGRALTVTRTTLLMWNGRESQASPSGRDLMARPVGTSVPAVTKLVTAEAIADFESCSSRLVGHGPRENLHNDPATARAAGLSAPIASGMMTVAYLNQMLAGAFGEAWARSGHLTVSFIRPVRAGAAVTARGTARESAASGAALRVELDVWCEDETGEKTAVGTADLTVPT